MKLTRKGIKTIQELLVKREPSLPDSTASHAFLKNIPDTGPMGIVRGKRIFLTSEEVRRIAIAYTQCLGHPVHTYNLNADNYLDGARQTAQEKVATATGPFAGLMHMAYPSPRGIPFVQGHNPVTPPGTFLFAEPAALDMTQINHALIVENGTPFRLWDRIRHIMPGRDETLILYRGHDKAAKLVLELLEKEHANCTFTVFFDFDGAGLEKAEQFANLGARQVILPSEGAALDVKMNKKAEFTKQRHQLYGVINRERYPSLTRAGNRIKDSEFAITQETLISNSVQLRVYPL